MNLNSEIGMGSARALRDDSGFTMVEIAICLAVIGVALVAIIGVLPIGMRAQRDNRERTVINQDATIFLEAIRNGARGADDLANYVYAITNFQTFTIPARKTTVCVGYGGGYLTNGARIIGLLSTPEYTDKQWPGAAEPVRRRLQQSHCRLRPFHERTGGGEAAAEQCAADAGLLHLPHCLRKPAGAGGGEFGLRHEPEANLHELRLTFLLAATAQRPVAAAAAGSDLSHDDCRAARLRARHEPTPNVNLYFFQPQYFTNAP